MANVKIVVNNKALREIYQQPGSKQAINEAAEDIANRANSIHQTLGANYVALPAQDSEVGSIALATTNIGNSTTVYKTRLDNARYNTLSKAIGGAAW